MKIRERGLVVFGALLGFALIPVVVGETAREISEARQKASEVRAPVPQQKAVGAPVSGEPRQAALKASVLPNQLVGAVLNQLLTFRNVTFLIVVFGFLGLLKVSQTRWFKGVIGEWQVNRAVKNNLNDKEYHLIKNVTLPTKDGTTQIDHVIVSKYGIFVIETKNMKGWIFGGEQQAKWTQKIYRHSSKFQNPLRQNYKHLKTLESVLGIGLDKMHSVIVFVGNSEFKTEMPDNAVSLGRLVSHIRSKQDAVLSETETGEIVGAIESGRLTRSLATDWKHRKHVKSIISRRGLPE